jgi:pimeloyl-ACP methyl ester carboxylesterase
MIVNKSFKSFVIRFFIYLQVLFLFISCENKKDSNQVNSFLIDYEIVSTIPVSTSQTMMTLLGIQYPEITPLISTTKYEVTVYRVNYKTHYKSQEITASGLICVPNSDKEFPLISFQNGTNTNNNNAPSVNPNNSSFLLLQSFAGNGYIVVIPDYIGFGASSQYLHPYYVKEPTNNAVIDLIHASDEFIKTASIKTKFNNHYYLMGYSQGGWATLCAYNQIETGNETFIIKAASCGAGAYNLINTSKYIAQQITFPGPLYLPYYIYSHQQYGTLSDPLSIYFNEPYATRIPGIFDGFHTAGQINSNLTDTVSSLLRPELISSLNSQSGSSDIYSSLKADLVANSIAAWPLNGLLHFYHGDIDDNVPVTESRNMYQDFLDLNSGGKVEYFEMAGLNHDSGVIPWGIKTLIWFNSLENSN